VYLCFLLKVRHGIFNVRIIEHIPPRPVKVSIIIPFRNEEAHIIQSLQSILKLDYDIDFLEAIYVNDASTDRSAQAFKDYERFPHIKLIELPESGKTESRKKIAIQTGIDHATGEIILGTDADCVFSPAWVKTMISMFDEHTGFVSGPVAYHNCKTSFEKIQQLEFSGLVLCGAGLIGCSDPMICNGANIAYRRHLFNQTDGFADDIQLSSGDDELLMRKIFKTGYKVKFCFNHDAVVYTLPSRTMDEFIEQRSRWASKGKYYKKNFLYFQLLPIFLFFVLLVSLPLFSVLSTSGALFAFFIVLFSIKSISEYSILKHGKEIFRNDLTPGLYLKAAVLQPVYIILAVIKGYSGRYRWKGRVVRK
jgi:cellulose synthase/poly-beta-1,6-N-acetylglucosamine synthase-like glycosyltransferase